MPNRLNVHLLGIAALGMLTASAGASQITGVTVYNGYQAYATGSFTPGGGSYPAVDAVDGNLGTDYASNGGGTATFLDFDLGSAQTLNQIIVTDRTSSGGGNGSHAHNTGEFNTGYNLLFSNDSTFATGTTTIAETATPPSSPPAGAAGDSAFSTTYGIPNITAEYVRVQVTAGGGNNGFAEVQFFTPEPGSLAGLGLGMLGLLARRRR